MKNALCLTILICGLISCKDTQASDSKQVKTDAIEMATTTISVTGIAGNAKLGAHLSTDTAGYYVDGLQEWPADLLDQRVTVVGSLKTVEHNKEDLYNAKGEVSQGMVGTQSILMNATWKRAE